MSAIHDAADEIEPRMQRAVEKAFAKMRERVSVNNIALAIANGQRRRDMGIAAAKAVDAEVNAILPGAVAADALAKAQAIVRDSVIRGGKIGAAQIREVLK